MTDQNQPQTPPASPEAKLGKEEKKSMPGFRVAIAFTVLTLVALIGLVTIFVILPVITQIKSRPIVRWDETPQVSVVDTSNWKTHKDDGSSAGKEFDFEFKYPKEWYISHLDGEGWWAPPVISTNEHGAYGGGGDFRIITNFRLASLSIEQWFKENDKYDFDFAQCLDTIDNDKDKLVDSADPDCHTDGNSSNNNSWHPADKSEFSNASQHVNGNRDVHDYQVSFIIINGNKAIVQYYKDDYSAAGLPLEMTKSYYMKQGNKVVVLTGKTRKSELKDLFFKQLDAIAYSFKFIK
jgi:hypothetical protein